MQISSIAATGKLRELIAGTAQVSVYASTAALGSAAAKEAAAIIADSIKARGRARIIVATGNSQLDLIGALVQQDMNWNRVAIFHMDEYVGIGADHPSSFRYWVRTRVEEKVHPGHIDYIDGDAADVDGETDRYSELLNSAPIDLAFVGFGENGHIAFNDPHVADFNDPKTVKRVSLDEACRKQQAGEGHFENAESVPKEALTVTCPGLFRAKAWVCCVPESRKAEAVRQALEGQISTACPASLVRTHPHASVYLDSESAALLS